MHKLTVECVEHLERLEAGAHNGLHHIDVHVLLSLPLCSHLPVHLVVCLCGWGWKGGGTREQCDGAGEACDSLPSDLGQHKEYVWVLVNECRNVTCHTSRTLGHLRTFYEYAVSSEDESVMGAKRYVVDLWRLKKRRCEVATCYFALCSFR